VLPDFCFAKISGQALWGERPGPGETGRSGAAPPRAPKGRALTGPASGLFKFGCQERLAALPPPAHQAQAQKTAPQKKQRGGEGDPSRQAVVALQREVVDALGHIPVA
jgi:hypothetical protein